MKSKAIIRKGIGFSFDAGNPWPWTAGKHFIVRLSFHWRHRIHNVFDYTETAFYRGKPKCKRLTLWIWRVFELNPQFSGRARG